MAMQQLRHRRRKRLPGSNELIAPTGNRSDITRIVQSKLRVSQPDDAQEREADAVADRVMSRTRAETAAPAADSDLTQRIRARRGAGHPLPGTERAFFEPRFGRDFSRVRIHTDGEAQQLSERINARAFTLGPDVFFNRGEFRAGQPDSRHLMAHELTHTLQQSNVKTDLLQREENTGEQNEEEPYSYGPEGFRFEPQGETCEPEEVSDNQVEDHIRSSLNRADDDPSAAFSLLRNEREQSCCNVNLAAAEHYMYARFQVQSGESSYAAMVLSIRGYDSTKSLLPDALIPRTGNCPPTPSSDAQTDWGLKGASDGKAHRED